MTLNHADKTWVTLWIEKYEDGKKESQPLFELSYGNAPDKVQQGELGFGIIHTNKDPLGFLYGPGIRTTPQKIENIRTPGVFTGWDYAMEEEKVTLQEGKTQLLGAYRVSKGNSIRTYDLQDEQEVKKMIRDDKYGMSTKNQSGRAIKPYTKKRHNFTLRRFFAG